MSTLNQSLAIGPVGISLSQLLIMFSLAIALIVGAFAGRRYKTVVSDTLFNVLLVSVAGARLVFVVRYHDAYDGLLAMVDIRDGGFDVIGGLLFGIVWVAWALWRSPKQRKPLSYALGAGIMTWGVTAGSLVLLDEQSRPIPETPLWTMDGEPISLSDLSQTEAKPLVVNLWATWCPPCRREMPVFEAVQQDEKDITFVFVNQGEDSASIERYLKAESLTLANVLLDPELAVGEETGAMAMPTTLFYDAEGRLVDTHFGELSRATLERGLEPLR